MIQDEPYQQRHARGGNWTNPDVPNSGWSCVDIEDTEEREHLCEMCQSIHVRYVHAMSHPGYHEALRVGCICAGKMENDISGARAREKGVKNSSARKRKWLSRKWRVSIGGNEFINTHDGFNVVVFSKGDHWGARVLHRESGYNRTSKLPYYSSDEVKLAAFRAMIGMKHAVPWLR